MQSFSAIAATIAMPVLVSIMIGLLTGAAVFAFLEHKGITFKK